MSPVTAPSPRTPSRRRAVRAGALAAVALVLAVTAAAWASVYTGLPSASDALQRVRHGLAAHHGTYVAVPPRARIARAVVGVEDRRFFRHGAVDPVALARVARTVVVGGHDAGGSTIGQQLAKVLYLDGRDDLRSKLRAIALADRLLDHYPRARVLDLYLNAVYFGHGAWGIARASQTYFHMPPGRLSWGQATMLAGVIQAPSAFDPLRHLQLARRRQREVVALLGRHHVITARTAAAIDATTTLDGLAAV